MSNDPTEGVMNCKTGPTAVTDQATVQVWWKLGAVTKKQVEAKCVFIWGTNIYYIICNAISEKKNMGMQ